MIDFDQDWKLIFGGISPRIFLKNVLTYKHICRQKDTFYLYLLSFTNKLLLARWFSFMLSLRNAVLKGQAHRAQLRPFFCSSVVERHVNNFINAKNNNKKVFISYKISRKQSPGVDHSVVSKIAHKTLYYINIHNKVVSIHALVT